MSEEKSPKEKTPKEIAQYFAKRSHEVKDEKTQDFFYMLALLASAVDEMEKDTKNIRKNEGQKDGS